MGVAGLVAGLVIGALVGATLLDSGDGPAPDATAEKGDVVPPPTTTAVTTVPPECIQTLRSAEQALQLIQQGLHSLRELQVGELDRVISEIERLRGGFTSDVRQCQERLRP